MLVKHRLQVFIGTFLLEAVVRGSAESLVGCLLSLNAVSERWTPRPVSFMENSREDGVVDLLERLLAEVVDCLVDH